MCPLFLAVQQLGFFEYARDILDRAVNLARGMGHQPTVAYVLYHAALFWMIGRDPDQVAHATNELRSIIEKHDLPYWRWHCNSLMGWTAGQSGSRRAGFARIWEAVSEGRQLHVNLWVPFYLVHATELLIEDGDYEEALQRLREVEALMGQLGQGYVEPELHRLQAVALASIGAADEVELHFQRALEAARRREMRLWGLRAATSCAQFRRAAGRWREAHHVLAPVYRWFPQGLCNPDLERARAFLDPLAEAADQRADSRRV
jgi:predicted ATPase